MRCISKYVWLGYTAARSNLAYSGEAVARTIFIGVILYIFLQLWSAVYGSTGEVRLGDLTLDQMLWYLMVTEAFWMSSSRIWTEVDEDVRTGRLAVQLTKPLSYPCALLAKSLGERVVRFSMNLAVGATVVLILVGPIPVTASGLLMFATLLPLSFALEALGLIVVGLCAFWVESTNGLALLYSRTVMLAGGAMLPLDLYPDSLRGVLEWLPFGSMIYGPARMLVAADSADWLQVVGIQVCSIAIFALVVAGVQVLGYRRIYSHGG